jgi:hypothetical protein
MGNTYGRRVLETTGDAIAVLADPENALWKAGGITVDWSLLTAVVAETTLADGTVVRIGDKYMRYGQVLCLIGKSEVQTITFTGGPTSGSAILTLPAAGSESAEVAAAIAFNASAQTVQDTLNALTRLDANGVLVTRSGAGTNGDPYIYSVTFNRNMGNVPQFTSTNDFAGGTTPTVTHATGTAGTGNAKYGPYDSGVTDGRQTLTRGECYILNETVLESESKSDHPPVFEGGLVWADRLLVGGSLQPTLANFLTAFPAIQLVRE